MPAGKSRMLPFTWAVTVVLLACGVFLQTHAHPVTTEHHLYRRAGGTLGAAEWEAWKLFKQALNHAGANTDDLLWDRSQTPARDLGTWTFEDAANAFPAKDGINGVNSKVIVNGPLTRDANGAVIGVGADRAWTEMPGIYADRIIPTINAQLQLAIAAVNDHEDAKAAKPRDPVRIALAKTARLNAVTQWHLYIDAVVGGYRNMRSAHSLRSLKIQNSQEGSIKEAHKATRDKFGEALVAIGSAYMTNPERPTETEPKNIITRSNGQIVEHTITTAEGRAIFLDAIRPGNEIVFPSPQGLIVSTVPAAPTLCNRDGGCAQQSIEPEVEVVDVESRQDVDTLVAIENSILYDEPLTTGELEFLSEIRTVIGDSNILPGGGLNDITDPVIQAVIFVRDQENVDEMAPGAIYVGAVDRASAWRSIVKSIKTFVSKPNQAAASQQRIAAAMSSWKRSIMQRFRQLSKVPREQRLPKAVADVAQKASIFNDAVKILADKAGPNAQVAVDARRYDLGQFRPDTANAFKSNDQLSSEAQIEGLRSFAEGGVPDILPDGGVAGLAIAVDPVAGTVSDQVDDASLYGDSIRGNTIDETIGKVGDAVAKFITKYSQPSAGQFQMKRSQFIQMKRGIDAYTRAADRYLGQGGALRVAIAKMQTAIDQIDPTTLFNDIPGGSHEDNEIKNLQKMLPLPSKSQTQTGPLNAILASNLEAIIDAPDETDATERIIVDSQKIVRSSDKKNFARVWKLIPRGLQKALSKINSGAVKDPGPVASAILSVSKALQSVNSKLAALDAKKDPEGLLASIKAVNGFNDLANDAILAGQGVQVDKSTGQRATISSLDIPSAAANSANAIRITTEISTLSEFVAADPNILPFGGNDWSTSNPTTTIIQGPNGPVRELSATEIYKGADPKQPKIAAWNKAIAAMKIAIAKTQIGAPVAMPADKVGVVKGQVERALDALKKNLSWRQETQKSVSPGDRDDDAAVDLDLHTENFRDLASSSQAADFNEGSREPTDGSASAVAGVPLNSEDLRSADTSVTANIVEGLNDLKPLSPLILPNTDVASNDGKALLPQSMLQGAASLDQVMPGAANAVARQLASSGKTLTSEAQIRTLQGFSKLQKAVTLMGKLAASSVGRASGSDLAPMINTISATQASLPTLANAMSANVATDTVGGGVTPQSSLSVAQVKAVQGAANVIPVSRPNPTSKKNLLLKFAKAVPGRVANNGKTPASGSGVTPSAGVGKGF
ncbi:hypothetical protein HDU90_004292 [Geranomyces variabilis]|nr:hypothetical protein HDU90_004292 [Geranomyces variabilis]